MGVLVFIPVLKADRKAKSHCKTKHNGGFDFEVVGWLLSENSS